MTKQLPNTFFARNKTNILVLDLDNDIEISLIDDSGNPVPHKKYQLQLTDNTLIEGTLDDKGYAIITGDNLEGAQVTFPELDSSSWMSESDHQAMRDGTEQPA